MVTPDTFDYENPQLFIFGVGLIDCSDQENYTYVLNVYRDKFEILDAAKSAAIKDSGSRVQHGKPPNPHNQLFSPLRWTAWNTSYSFWMKHCRCKAHPIDGLEAGESSNGVPDGTQLGRAMAASRMITVSGYREIARQAGSAPTSKTSDDEIMNLYQKVLTAFRTVSEERNERIPAGIKNTIAFHFLQVKEMAPAEFFEEHLKYEIEWYRQNGLRESYRKEINLFKILGLPADGGSSDL